MTLIVRRVLPVLAVLLAGPVVLGQETAPRPAAPPGPVARRYRPTEEMKGNIRVVGSTALSYPAAVWSEGLRKFHPQLTIDIACEGSETAFPEMGGEGLTVAALSRPVADEEITKLEEKTHKKYAAYTVCYDQLVIIVHPDNPIASLTPAQLRTVFGSPGEEKAALTWGQLGLTGDWAERPVTVHLLPAGSGARGFLRAALLSKGQKERAGQEVEKTGQLTELVAADKGGIAVSRKARLTDDVKVVPVLARTARGTVAAQAEVPLLARPMTLDVPVGDDRLPTGAVREFVVYALSRDGQVGARLDGFRPLDRSALSRQLDKLGISELR